MSIYEEVRKENEEVKDLQAKNIESKTKQMLDKLKEVTKFFDDLGLIHTLEFDGWFKRIEIKLSENSDSAYSKSRLRVMPGGILKYYCNHYSVNIMSTNEVLTEEYDIDSLEDGQLIALIKSDITQVNRFY